MHTIVFRLIALATTAGSLAACGNQNDNRAAPTDWLSTDTCALVDSSDLATVFENPAQVRATRRTDPTGPFCEWTSMAGFNSLQVGLMTAPPGFENVKPMQVRSFGIGGHTVSVGSEERGNCNVGIFYDNYRLTISIHPDRAKMAGSTANCDAQKPLIERITARVDQI
ncbi:hypothetical protein FOS14_07145 [Skermania sp. ID1734]|uniref:hypothetical protein n=1 Tax=Skermania sp. ID1734 TaxID=2597516 RepID=UPI00117D28E5|nr:hypothetical protein [Skermania sp. ID1734]TSE00778.1 hypothetical protein FOS14_07145 [Skermania sp. ID1734]